MVIGRDLMTAELDGALRGLDASPPVLLAAE